MNGDRLHLPWWSVNRQTTTRRHTMMRCPFYCRLLKCPLSIAPETVWYLHGSLWILPEAPSLATSVDSDVNRPMPRVSEPPSSPENSRAGFHCRVHNTHDPRSGQLRVDPFGRGGRVFVNWRPARRK